MKTEDLRLHEVLHTFEKRGRTLHVTEQPEHTGIAEGVQAELSLAKGEYLIFLRQEDLPTPDALLFLPRRSMSTRMAYCSIPTMTG